VGRAELIDVDTDSDKAW